MTALSRKSAQSMPDELALAFDSESQAKSLLAEISDLEVRKLATEAYVYFAKDVTRAVDQHLSKSDPAPIRYSARVEKDEMRIHLEIETKLDTMELIESQSGLPPPFPLKL